MRIFEPRMSQEIDSFLIQLLNSSREKEVVDMSHRCEWLGVDVVGELAFGCALNTQSDPLHRAMVDGIKARGDTGSLYFFWRRLRNFDWVFNKLSRSGRTEGLYRSLKMIIVARMKIPKDAKHDFFSMASGGINSKDPGIIEEEFWAEALLFIAAGGTTTATAMSGAFFYLSRNPTAYQRLAAEIRNTFSSGHDIRQGLRLSQCKYLRAVIEETMRMSPSALAIAWREQYPESVAAGESFIVDGHVIPPGTQVGVSNYCLQHDPSIFAEPFAFRPERWLLPGSGDSEATDQSEAHAAMRYAFAPFSLGDRGCAGKPMAYLEMSLVIAKVMWYFDFERAAGAIGDLGGGTVGRKDGRGRANEFQLYEGVVVGHYGPNLMFTPRENYHMDIKTKQAE
ncbi:cytochrome P450 [Phaeosphaeria sp. MPI-PUGE-AT-0046c]|nr:cytochrome P450 [Phaeosphaeria sp. MPI-PUGE-AT-0046c]